MTLIKGKLGIMKKVFCRHGRREMMNAYETIMYCLKKVKGEGFNQNCGLISDGWIDSFGLLRLVHELETVFQVKIPIQNISPENFDDIESINKILIYCKAKIPKEVKNKEEI